MVREQHYAALHYRIVTQIGATFYTARVPAHSYKNTPAELHGAYTEVCCPDCQQQLQWKSKCGYQRKSVDVWRCPRCGRLFALLD